MADPIIATEQEESPTYIAGYDWDLCIEADEPLNWDIVLWIKSDDYPKFSYEEDKSEKINDKSICFIIPRKETTKLKEGVYKWMLAIYDKNTNRITNTEPQTFIVKKF